VWSPSDVEQYSTPDFQVFAAAEVNTDFGHALVFGLNYHPRSRCIRELKREVEDGGGAIVLAHPFRGHFDHWRDSGAESLRLERLAESGAVHAIEVLNNGCTDSENRLAGRLADAAGLRMVAGSDAHVIDHLGSCTTAFADVPRDGHDLASRLVSGEGVLDLRGPSRASQLKSDVAEVAKR